MKALVLAAGYATRLYPLTKEYPKSLLKAGEKTILDYIIEKLERIDKINEIIVITNSKFIGYFRKWARDSQAKKRLVLVDDLTKSIADRRGAIGDMNFAIAKKRIKEDLLVIGGDNLFNGDLQKFISFARAKKKSPAVGIYRLEDKREAARYGVVKLDQENRVVDFQEKPKMPQSSFVAMCLYYFPKEKLRLIREYLKTQTEKHDATGFYIDWLRRKVRVYGFIFKGRWFDIGDAKFYREAKKVFVK